MRSFVVAAVLTLAVACKASAPSMVVAPSAGAEPAQAPDASAPAARAEPPPAATSSSEEEEAFLALFEDPNPRFATPCTLDDGGALSLSSGAALACKSASPSVLFVPQVEEMIRLEADLERADPGARAPLLRRLSEIEFAWECDSFQRLQTVCGRGGQAGAEPFRRVLEGVRQRAEEHCEDLRRHHPSYANQCP